MKIRSKKPKGQRIFKSTHKNRPIWIEPIGSGWWFNLKIGEWVKNPIDFGKIPYITSYYSMEHRGYKNIWSIKATKRTIFNWDVPKGTTFKVRLPWVGYSFLITK